MKAAHLVPLSTQALTVLAQLRELTGAGRFVFPGLVSASQPMSENTVNAALRRLGYSGDEMTGHGFRSMAARGSMRLAGMPMLLSANWRMRRPTTSGKSTRTPLSTLMSVRG